MQVEHLKITGMTCNGCTGNVTDALEAISEVKDVEVSLSAGAATVQYDELLISPDHLKSAVTKAGYGVVEGKAIHGAQTKAGGCH